MRLGLRGKGANKELERWKCSGQEGCVEAFSNKLNDLSTYITPVICSPHPDTSAKFLNCVKLLYPALYYVLSSCVKW